MTRFNKTSLGFILIIVLVACIGVFSVHTVKSLSVETERLYNHPFAVSNAAREININMVSMHRYMKDVVLAQNAEQLERASAQVDVHENKVFDSFRVIFDRFLGDKDKIHAVYQSFVLWRDIRNEVITLKRAGQSQAAAEITKGKGAEHVQLLSEQTQELVNFANSKASEFRERSLDNAERSVIVMSVLSAMAGVLSFFIAVFIVRSQKHSESEISKRSHLIDQNILMARLDTKGDVVEISNALCRYLEVLQSDILHTPSHFFVVDKDNTSDLEQVIWRLLQTGAEWKGEIKRITRNGYAKWAKLTVLPELDARYQINGYTCILQDMTSKKLSLTDNLTTLGNRRQYEEVLEREINIAKRHDTYLSLAILDIDFFKNYNDRYGHPQGDSALAQVGKAILACMRRPNDYTFRIGGEEFAVLFSSNGPDDARIFLDNIRHSVEALQIPHASSTVSEHLTISIGGVTTKGASLIDAEHFYIDADKALYLAKETRNLTVMA